jgi:histidine triad (HIT) family protein
MTGTSDCIFCRLAAGGIPATIVDEGAEWVAFRDTNPQAPVHVLLIPRRHIASLAAVTEDNAALLGELMVAASRVAAAEGLSEGGYRLVVNAGQDGGQTVHHLHLHLLGGRAMRWPPG